jgi:hypothetical protein
MYIYKYVLKKRGGGRKGHKWTRRGMERGAVDMKREGGGGEIR